MPSYSADYFASSPLSSLEISHAKTFCGYARDQRLIFVEAQMPHVFE